MYVRLYGTAHMLFQFSFCTVHLFGKEMYSRENGVFWQLNKSTIMPKRSLAFQIMTLFLIESEKARVVEAREAEVVEAAHMGATNLLS